MHTRTPNLPLAQAALLSGLLLAGTGCNPTPSTHQPGTVPDQTQLNSGRSDQQITSDIQNRIGAESALNGQNIQVNVSGGTATLSGTVDNDASRALASNDAGGVVGVKTVLNNLTVAPPVQAQAPAPPPAPSARERERASRRRESASRSSANVAPPAQQSPPAPQYQAPVQNVQNTPPPPPAPPAVKTVTVAAGTAIPVRLVETLDTGTTKSGDVFQGTLASDILSEGMIAVPRGTAVSGRVVDAKDATHFAGNASLSIELTSMTLPNGRQVPLVTNAVTQQGKGRGKNTAEKAGGGAAIGAIIGALAGGGKGAAIGAASGGGLGAGVNAVTRGQQVKIPAETLLNFSLQNSINVITKQTAGASRNFSDTDQPQLQPR